MWVTTFIETDGSIRFDFAAGIYAVHYMEDSSTRAYNPKVGCFNAAVCSTITDLFTFLLSIEKSANELERLNHINPLNKEEL